MNPNKTYKIYSGIHHFVLYYKFKDVVGHHFQFHFDAYSLKQAIEYSRSFLNSEKNRDNIVFAFVRYSNSLRRYEVF